MGLGSRAVRNAPALIRNAWRNVATCMIHSASTLLFRMRNAFKHSARSLWPAASSNDTITYQNGMPTVTYTGLCCVSERDEQWPCSVMTYNPCHWHSVAGQTPWCTNGPVIVKIKPSHTSTILPKVLSLTLHTSELAAQHSKFGVVMFCHAVCLLGSCLSISYPRGALRSHAAYRPAKRQ